MQVEELKPDALEYQVAPGTDIHRLEYFEKLNVIIVITKRNDLLVVDPTLGDVVYKSKIKDGDWDLCVSNDRIILSSNDKTGIRSDYNGILLLDTLLQTPIEDSSLPVELELSRTEVESLLQCFIEVTPAESDIVEVIKQLKQGLRETENATVPLYSIKKEKWNTVKLHLPHSVLKSTFQAIYTDFCKKNFYLPQLSIAASVIERLNMYLPSSRTDLDLPADKAQMFSEFARLNTFINWPHHDYKWAHPLKMAQAGFYHNPNTSTVEDRVMCFACSVCLVSWEPTDEPWSEHERHSPFCPFVRGEHTQNVPLSLSYATAPASSVKKTTPIGKPIIGRTTECSLSVVGYTTGFVVVCDTLKFVKILEFDVSISDIYSVEPLSPSAYSDVRFKPKEAWLMDSTDAISPNCTLDETRDDKLVLSAIALIGNSKHGPTSCTSSLVIGGSLSQFVVEKSESGFWENTAFVLLFGLTTEKCIDISKDASVTDSINSTKNTGTKLETSQYEEELFSTYMQENDLLSDASLLSDITVGSPTISDLLNDSTVEKISKKLNKTKPKPILYQEATVVSLTQKLVLPSGLSKITEIIHLIPTPDGTKLVISAKRDTTSSVFYGIILLYNIINEDALLRIGSEPVAVYETILDIPVDIRYVPNNDPGTLACVLKSGLVLIFSSTDLSLLATIKPSEGNLRITSICYSNGLERLCCGTNIGSIVLYNPSPDSDSTGDREVLRGTYESLIDNPDLITNQELTYQSMQNILTLTELETIKPCFAVNAPSCWTKVIQAQKDRKHPQHLQHSEIDSNISTLSWRLQKTKNSRKEHLFEITLPKATHVGHFDVKFQLQQGCVSIPNIEVTLYQVPKNSVLKPSSPTKNADWSPGSQIKTKVSSTEFLKSVNAEIVAGPLDFTSHMDLSAQSGNLVMTSPSLILSKARHFYLYIKSIKSSTKFRSSTEGCKIPKPSKSQTKNSTSKVSKTAYSKEDLLMYEPVFPPMPGKELETSLPSKPAPISIKPEPESDKRREFGGCDWIHELSITVRQVKKTSIPNETLERQNLVESTELLERLLNTAIFQGSERTYSAQKLAFELIVWIGAINLSGPQIGRRPYQLNFIKTVKTKLQGLILHGIIYADRSTAHKCAKLLVLCIDVFCHNDCPNLREEIGFSSDVLLELMNVLPHTLSCESAGALQWFFLLLSRVRRFQPLTACESLLSLLNIVSEEVFKRNDPMHSILKTRFGLFGTPFEPELFELELPPFTKSYSSSLNYAGLCNEQVNNGQASTFPAMHHLWGQKDVDFRELLVGSLFSTKWGKSGCLTPRQQLHGLLEVEQLHFNCHAASDGTRIEKIDLGFHSTNSMPLAQTFEPFTPTSMPTGEGSKKTEPDKMEHLMMLQSLKKLSSANLGSAESYYDAFNDLKFLEENSNVLDVAFDMHSNLTQPVYPHMNAPSWKSGILSMVMQEYKPMEIHDSKSISGLPSQSHLKLPSGKQSSSTSNTPNASSLPKPAPTTTKENDGLKLLLSPWQKMMNVPPQQAIVIDRMHSGARRFVVLDFGSPILLTDFLLPSCSELVSVSIDVWLNREDLDGQRLVVASDISTKSLLITDLQPPVLCRYLKLTAIGRYGMATTKCKFPLGLFYGHTAVLEEDLRDIVPGDDVPILTHSNVHNHLSLLNYLVEDIGCRYQLACAKLRRLLDPLVKPELSSLDHISYFLPKGKERNRLCLNSSTDQAILLAYQECVTLQQQFNVAKNVIRRLQKSLKPYPLTHEDVDPTSFLAKVSSDKLRFLTEFLVEALLGASLNKFRPNLVLKSLHGLVTQDMCEKLFRNICTLENGQCQLSISTLLLRVAGNQPWWGKFLSHTLKTSFSSNNTTIFPQDRVFILMVYLGQRALLSGRNSSVVESVMELLLELVSPVGELKGFISSKVDMTLYGWVVMYLCLLLDGIYCSFSQDDLTSVRDLSKDPKEVVYVSPRWDFIQGEIALYKQFRSPNKGGKASNFKRQFKKHTITIKQKLEELEMVQGNFVNISQMKNAIKNNALGSVNFPLPTSQLPKGYKPGACKNLKEALLKKPEAIPKRFPTSKLDKEELLLWPEIELNVNLSHSLCMKLAKDLGALILKMDSTCHSDVFLVTCKALARVATSCRPAVPLGTIFKQDQIIELLLPAVGTDFVKQNNWSSAWVSHAVMCLMQDLMEGEKLFPIPAGEQISHPPGLIFSEETFPPLIPNTVCMDDLEVTEPMEIPSIPGTSGTTSNVSVESTDSENEGLLDELSTNSAQKFSAKQYNLTRFVPSLNNISVALDSRLESGVESASELRLRKLAVIDAETMFQSLQSPVEPPEDYLKKKPTSHIPKEVIFKSEVPTTFLLSNCFDKIFRMMASESRSISVERVLQLWLSLNFDLQNGNDEPNLENRPIIPLSYDSVFSLMTSLTRSTGIGIQEWGLGFQCLHLAASENPICSSSGLWLNIITSKQFPEIILKFLSGAGMNLQQSVVPVVGPNVCLHFYNFLLRLRQYSNDSSWTPFLKELLLRILSVFLSGTLLASNFPMDAVNKFLDRVTCQDLSYESLSTVVSIVESFANALEQYVFYPDKISVRSNAELKGAPPSTTASGLPITNETIKMMKPQNLENLMLKLLSLVTSIISLPYKPQSMLGEVETSLLGEIQVSSNLAEYNKSLVDHIKNFEQEPKTVADVIVQMEPIMMRLLSILANPKITGFPDNQAGSTHFDTGAPTTVTEGVMNLITKLSMLTSKPEWIVKPIFKFLSKSSYHDLHCPLIVSEPFVLMVLNVLNNQDNLVEFVKLNCVESVCQKLVASSRRFISSLPTFMSILTQFIGKTDPSQIFGHKKFGHETYDLPEGILNVAPLGIISSTNYSAHPSEVLLQATPPHRRARAPVWSYHFYPEEKFLELLVTLPCAVLLKEIQIVPHISTLTTNSPSALMVEISRDRSLVSTPLGPPVQCAGLTTINVRLHQPEVAQTILLRLFKPKDSSNLGLSQIRILGCTTFSEAALQGLAAPDSGQFLESSAQWMYILDRAIKVSQGDLKKRIVDIAVTTPDILESCYSLLMSQVVTSKVQEIYLPKLASVLFQFASLKIEVSQQLLEALLGPVQLGFSHAMVTNAHAQGSTRLTQLNTVVELIYNLCCKIQYWGSYNLTNLIKWVESRADEASQGNVDYNEVVPEYIQAVAAALWTIAAERKIDLSQVATPNLLVKLLNWTRLVNPNTELKAAIDHMICSVCYAKPWLFSYLMFLMDLLKPVEWAEKDKPIENLLENWVEENCLWERVTVKSLIQISPYLKTGNLMTIARAAQSESCGKMLDDSQFLGHLNTAIMDFWNHFTTLWMNSNNQVEDSIISTTAFISVLQFYEELCHVLRFKTWFGEKGSVFWLPILTLLCTLPEDLKNNFFGSEVYDLESAVINFLAKCCWLHTNNQAIIAKCLCDIIMRQKVSSPDTPYLHSMSAFCRRLIIQLLLENEKVVVHVKNKTKLPFKSSMRTLDLKHKHPSMGVNGTDRIFEISAHHFVHDVMRKLEPLGVKLPKFNLKSASTFGASLKKSNQSTEYFDFDTSDSTDAYNACRPIKIPSKKFKTDGLLDNKQINVAESVTPVMIFEVEKYPDIILPPELEITTVLAAVRSDSDTLLDNLVLISRIQTSVGETKATQAIDPEVPSPVPDVFKIQPLTFTIDVFSRLGGLALLAKNLPVVYPDTLRTVGMGPKSNGNFSLMNQLENKDNPIVMDTDWVKIESADDFYDEMMDNMIASTPVTKRTVSMAQFTSALGIPPHTMSAFGLFLGLPGFSEVLLSDRIGAQCMLRLSMGVTDDADGNDILSNPQAKALSTLPFNVLRCILDIFPIDSETGILLRKAMVGVKAIHFILACLAVFTHQKCDSNLIHGGQHELVIAATKAQGGYSDKSGKSDDKSHVYWAKGTGFGTGSTVQSWDVELAMQKRKSEEENVTCLLQVLSSYINPNYLLKLHQSKSGNTDSIPVTQENGLPTEVYELIKCSSLLPAIAGYLRNDSILDMARHIPLYSSVLQFLRALVSSKLLIPLLLPSEMVTTDKKDEQPISVLLCKMKNIVDSYSKRLTRETRRGVKGKTGGKTPEPDLEDEGLAQLIPDIQSTATVVDSAVKQLIMEKGPGNVDANETALNPAKRSYKSLEERYIEIMQNLQFDFFDMIAEDESGTGIRFTVSHHYEGNIRTNWTRTTGNRQKRLAQESVTLSTSLPIAYGSTIFVRCDTDRLDVMKVLITGPAGTPYSNGCFEFDIYFPSDYPSAPMLINLETTGRQRIRFNPNLYTDGKVCLSILNTWHGRPEEKWNPQTGSLLPVLVAIQSLILNAEPYFNEPGYEKSRGTEQGERNSREYNAGIKIATLEWAMLDQIKNPTACFKDVIHHHFYMKRAEIVSQCQKWLLELIETCRYDKRAGKSVTGNLDPVAVFKNNFTLLKKEFANMQPPPGLEDLTDDYSTKMEEGSSGGSTPVLEIPKEQETWKQTQSDLTLGVIPPESDANKESNKASDT